MCFQLFTSEHAYGSLNLYSDRDNAFSCDDETTGVALAAHVAVALASHRQIDNLTIALQHRTHIGEAKGILMERYNLTDDTAFQVLVRVSQDENRKLHTVAENLVTTRQIPGTRAALSCWIQQATPATTQSFTMTLPGYRSPPSWQISRSPKGRDHRVGVCGGGPYRRVGANWPG